MLSDLKQKYPWPVKPDVRTFYHGFLHESNKFIFNRHRGDDIKVVIELGSWLGQSALYFYDLFPNAEIICIDHWEGSPELMNEYREVIPVLYETFLVNCWNYRDRITPIRIDSLNGLEICSKFGVDPDLIYIDASHTYDDCFQDMVFAYNLFENAIIIGDDWQYQDVREAVNDFNEKYGTSVDVVDNTWEIIRP